MTKKESASTRGAIGELELPTRGANDSFDPRHALIADCLGDIISIRCDLRIDGKDPQVRIVHCLLLSSTLAVGLIHCAKRTANMDVTPPLPPAEEPIDAPGAYAGDAGAPR